MEDRCRREIVGLHDQFVRWFTGTIDRDGFDRIEAALAPEFELVTPDGDRLERDGVLEWLRDSYGREEPGDMEIDIEDVALLETTDTHALARYEEWERTTDGRTGRISTALFRQDPDAPEGVTWVALHETALEHGE